MIHLLVVRTTLIFKVSTISPIALSFFLSRMYETLRKIFVSHLYYHDVTIYHRGHFYFRALVDNYMDYTSEFCSTSIKLAYITAVASARAGA